MKTKDEIQKEVYLLVEELLNGFCPNYADVVFSGSMFPEKLSEQVAEIFEEQVKSKWTLLADGLPQDHERCLFQLINGEIRFGLFLALDQWDRPNMFCGDGFHFANKVVQYLPISLIPPLEV